MGPCPRQSSPQAPPSWGPSPVPGNSRTLLQAPGPHLPRTSHHGPCRASPYKATQLPPPPAKRRSQVLQAGQGAAAGAPSDARPSHRPYRPTGLHARPPLHQPRWTRQPTLVSCPRLMLLPVGAAPCTLGGRRATAAPPRGGARLRPGRPSSLAGTAAHCHVLSSLLPPPDLGRCLECHLNHGEGTTRNEGGRGGAAAVSEAG